MSVYNRLSRPIAVLGSRAAFMHLCHHVSVNPHNNDLFYHVDGYDRACGKLFSRVIEIDGYADTRDYSLVKSIVMRNIRNEAAARPSKPVTELE